MKLDKKENYGRSVRMNCNKSALVYECMLDADLMLTLQMHTQYRLGACLPKSFLLRYGGIHSSDTWGKKCGG